MTIKQIMAVTPENRRTKAKYVAVKQVKIRVNAEDMPMVLAKTMSTHKMTPNGIVPNKNPTVYLTTIEVYPKKQVKVSCSCDDFMYTWEVALNLKDAARIEFSNGEMPDERNPKKIPGCCGHIYALGQLLIDKGKL